MAATGYGEYYPYRRSYAGDYASAYPYSDSTWRSSRDLNVDSGRWADTLGYARAPTSYPKTQAPATVPPRYTKAAPAPEPKLSWDDLATNYRYVQPKAQQAAPPRRSYRDLDFDDYARAALAARAYESFVPTLPAESWKSSPRYAASPPAPTKTWADYDYSYPDYTIDEDLLRKAADYYDFPEYSQTLREPIRRYARVPPADLPSPPRSRYARRGSDVFLVFPPGDYPDSYNRGYAYERFGPNRPRYSTMPYEARSKSPAQDPSVTITDVTDAENRTQRKLMPPAYYDEMAAREEDQARGQPSEPTQFRSMSRPKGATRVMSLSQVKSTKDIDAAKNAAPNNKQQPTKDGNNNDANGNPLNTKSETPSPEGASKSATPGKQTSADTPCTSCS